MYICLKTVNPEPLLYAIHFDDLHALSVPTAITARLSIQLTDAAEGFVLIPYPTAFPYGNGMVLHFYQQQESSTTKTVHKVINKGLKTYV